MRNLVVDREALRFVDALPPAAFDHDHFDRGRIVHAEFGRLVGEPAFTALVVTSHREPGGTFCFNAMEGATAFQRTIERSVDSLLISTAAGIDEGRADTAAGVSSN